MARSVTSVLVDGRDIILSNLNKIYWPDDGYTKAQLVAHYVDSFPFLVDYLKDRPLVVTRYPHGIKGQYFYQKNAPAGAPDWITTFAVTADDQKRITNYIICNDLSTLVWLINSGVIELHPWLSRTTNIDCPDFAIFDLDPDPPSGFVEAKQLAFVLRRLLMEIDTGAVIKTSGATGLHVYVPLAGNDSYEKVRDFCRLVSNAVARHRPDIATVQRKVKDRQGKVYIDWLQNIKGQTICAPFCVRPLPNAPVSTPVSWDELPMINKSDNIITIKEHLRSKGKLFSQVLGRGKNIAEMERALHEVVKSK